MTLCDGLDQEKLRQWAHELSQINPLNAFHEDGEYAFYRNIRDEPDFPFARILNALEPTLKKYFEIRNVEEELRLDDAFCIHYNTDQHDTTGKKHMDPSDITVNFCLERSADLVGSHVLFFGEKQLTGVKRNEDSADKSNQNGGCKQYLVAQEAGFATVHYGGHWHQTMELKHGRRTNVVLTYCFTDPSKSEASRTCYATKAT
eukprot:CAMPEP_0196813586 /NCGR_PEP_ID=MMETSP1362-20130617/37772_1 /TAXON_ID=163516 /ORGANISM="Leptocylindrus danicus, Strain CCMP1856" /LENGTH=202 /DNA_ID=CAMNT_0042189893 /DNA_START=67 /DNA_END=675 /DNA_ORIENTATION=+